MKHLKRVSVECRHIGLSYDGGRSDVLKDVSLRIEPGEFFALLGPSGSGKSALLRLIAGFTPMARGQLLLDGQDMAGIPPQARNIGMVFQSYALWPHMTVWDNVAFGLVERKLPKRDIVDKVGAALELVALPGLARRYPNELSGGEQQRVALARTLVIEPQVLLLDEPLSNLDKKLRVAMRQELVALQRKLGITTLFVTHDQEDAMTTADRMAVLDKGVIQQLGTPAALFDYPANSFVAHFVGTTNLLEGRIDSVAGDMVRFESPGIGHIALPRHPDARCGRVAISFRPHTIRVSVGDGVRDAALIWLDGVIDHSEFLGEFTRYRVRVGNTVVTADQPHFSGMLAFPMATRVRLGIDASQVRYLPL